MFRGPWSSWGGRGGAGCIKAACSSRLCSLFTRLVPRSGLICLIAGAVTDSAQMPAQVTADKNKWSHYLLGLYHRQLRCCFGRFPDVRACVVTSCVYIYLCCSIMHNSQSAHQVVIHENFIIITWWRVVKKVKLRHCLTAQQFSLISLAPLNNQSHAEGGCMEIKRWMKFKVGQRFWQWFTEKSPV